LSAQQKTERGSLASARILLIVTILYNAIEGVVAIAAGVAAGSLARSAPSAPTATSK
jgi:hypothetical protein